MKKLNCKKAETVLFYTLSFVTATWFFLIVNKGIDVTDVAYYLTKYKYYFDSEMQLKSIGMFFNDLLGALIYHSVPSHQVLVLAICHWLLYMLSGLFIYKCLKKYVPRLGLVACIFIGSLFSLTWIKVMNYNATSMFMQTSAVCVMIKGLEQEEKRAFFWSGLLFGLNIYFRLPNVLQMGIGVMLIWYFGICKKDWNYTAKAVKSYGCGLVTGGLFGGAIAFLIIEKELIFAYFSRTVTSATSSESSHGILNIFSSILKGGMIGVVDWIRYGTALLILLILFRLFIKKKEWNEKSKKVLEYAISFLFIFAGCYVGYTIEYLNAFQMIGVGIWAVLFLGIWIYREKDPLLSALSGIGFCAELVLMVGTNNAWYYQIVFLMFPLGLCYVVVYKLPKGAIKANIRVILGFVIAFMLVCGLRYATGFVYRDAENSQLHYTISAKEYGKMKTTKERAAYLDEMTEVLDCLDENYLLSYGDCNIGYVISDMKPFLKKKVWIDLENYSIERFQNELDEAVEEHGYPVILIADLDQDGVYRSEEKLEMLILFMEEAGYEIYYENQWYHIYACK